MRKVGVLFVVVATMSFLAMTAVFAGESPNQAPGSKSAVPNLKGLWIGNLVLSATTGVSQMAVEIEITTQKGPAFSGLATLDGNKIPVSGIIGGPFSAQDIHCAARALVVTGRMISKMSISLVISSTDQHEPYVAKGILKKTAQ